MNHAETLRYLESVEGLGIKLALENVTQVLAALGDPQRAFPSVIVAGTNGKGSVAAMLASILRQAGFRTGLYTSPHLVRHEERIVVDGRPIPPEAFAAAVTRVRAAAESLLAAGSLRAHPTHFETLTAAAFSHFVEAGIGLGVLEVGMGGRLDATVLARPRLALITNVDLEHTAYLGATIGAIAAEKAGVLAEGGTLLTGETHPDALRAFRERAARTGGRLILLSEWVRAGTARGGLLDVETRGRRHTGLRPALRGPHQAANAALAVAACDLLEEMGFAVPAASIRRGLEETVWPGRFQVVEGTPRLVLDGAHNPAACRVLRKALAAEGVRPEASTFVFGVLRDKDHLSMLRELLPRAGRVILTRGRSERFRDPHALLEPAREAAKEATVAEPLAEALAEARRLTPPAGTVCVTGSLYLVGEAMEVLGIEPWPVP